MLLHNRVAVLTRRAFVASSIAVGATRARSTTPEQLPYEVDPDWPRLPPGWNFQETPGVAVDANDHVYVFHRGKHPIIEFTPEGRMVRSWGDGMFIRPHAIRIDPQGSIWIVDNDTHQVLKMDGSGRLRMVMGRYARSGEGPDLFNRPTDVAFSADGSFYVSDGYGNSRVARFAADGTFLTAWGTRGEAPGQFNLPHTVVVGPNGKVYVGDRENYRLQIFEPGGQFIEEWTHVGSPWGLAIDRDHALFIADGHNNRILKTTLEGAVHGQISSAGKTAGKVDFAHHLAVDSRGNVYVAEIKNWRVQKFVPVTC